MEVPPVPRGSKIVPLALGVAVIVLVAVFGYYYVQSSGTIAALNSTITSQIQESMSQSAQLSAESAQILKDDAAMAKLNATIAADSAQITLLRAGYAAANTTIASLDSQVGVLNTQITADNAQVATLQTQVSSLQAIAKLTDSASEVASQSYVTNSSGFVLVATFPTSYAGYVEVTLSAASDPANEGFFTDNTYAPGINSPDYSGAYTPFNGVFYIAGSVPNTQLFSVVTGAVSVYLATSDVTAQSGTVTVTYYY